MYRVYQILLTMLKLDWAMMVILAAMVSVFVFKPDDYEIIVVIVSVIVMIGWVWLGFFSVGLAGKEIVANVSGRCNEIYKYI